MRFSEAWTRVETRFLKLECWQAYQEIEGNRSQEEYRLGNIEKARALLQLEAESDRSVYEDIRNRGIDFARIRLVQDPVTDYLNYELLSYRIRASMGENIEIVCCDSDLVLPDEGHFDFLLFDRHTALIHDYGKGSVGLQGGGWVAHDPDVVESLEEIAVAFREDAVPLERFLVDRQIIDSVE